MTDMTRSYVGFEGLDRVIYGLQVREMFHMEHFKTMVAYDPLVAITSVNCFS